MPDLKESPEERRGCRKWAGCGCAVLFLFPFLCILIIGTPDGNGFPQRFYRRDMCLSNMREISLALAMYANDYESLPSSYLVNHAKTWNKADFTRFATTRGSIGSGDSRSIGEAKTWFEALYPYKKNTSMIFCREDNNFAYDPKPNATVSYWYRAALDKAWYGEGCAKPCRSEGDFAYQSSCIVFYERAPLHFQDQIGLKWCDDATGLRNDVKINVAYMDCHTEVIVLKNATSGNKLDCAANADGEPMYFNFDNTKPISESNPGPDDKAATYTDPTHYSDNLEEVLRRKAR